MKVAFAGPFAVQLAEPVRAHLATACDVITEPDEAAVAAQLSDVDVLVSMGFDAAMATAASQLRLLQVPGAGLDRVDRKVLPSATHLANVYGHEAGIAEYVIGAMIALTRSFARIDARLREGIWESQFVVGRPPPPLWPELAGKTLGILGFGHIGQAIARRAAAFDMQVCAIRQNVPAKTPAGLSFIGGPDRLEDVLQQSDALAVTLPLSDATRNLVGAPQLQLMKPTSIIINVARAEIINQAALYQALATGQIAGAALDVWYRYPSSNEATLPATHPFHELDNVIMTPHASGWTEGMLSARAKLIAENIERAIRGEEPLNRIVQ
ncbi:MAG: phosphoglycerate dehydrogenase [Hyphomicrobiaceae bacterium]